MCDVPLAVCAPVSVISRPPDLVGVVVSMNQYMYRDWVLQLCRRLPNACALPPVCTCQTSKLVCTMASAEAEVREGAVEAHIVSKHNTSSYKVRSLHHIGTPTYTFNRMSGKMKNARACRSSRLPRTGGKR